jgi:hypothetical protein
MPMNPIPSPKQVISPRPSIDPIAEPLFHDRIELCEPRLALSANVAADVLIDAFSSGPSGTDDPLAANLISDAAAVRQKFSLDGAGQTVAVIDSGIAWDHVAFAKQPNGWSSAMAQGNRIVGGWDFAENDANPYDDGPTGYHGTHVAGTLAGNTNGFAGVAPGADLVALRVFDDFSRGSLDWIESALRWVIDNRTAFENPITTVNLSLGAFATNTSQPLTQLDDELQQLYNDGVIVVAAAGNTFNANHPDALAYPASHPLVAAVTSVDTNGNVQDFAQRAHGVFATTGGSIRSSVPEHIYGADGVINDYATLSGTSMASPQFAGATMLVRQAMQNTGLEPTPADILSHLRETSLQRTDPLTGASFYEIDLGNSISAIVSNNPSSPSQTTDSPLQWTDSNSLVVRTTEASDTIVLDLSGRPMISVNSVVYPIDRPFQSLRIDGGIGTDTLEIIGRNNDEQLIARTAIPHQSEASATFQSLGLSAEFTSFENIVFRGGGGNDRATWFDSVGNDTLEASATQATMRGPGFTFIAHNIHNIYAHATNGGIDTAYLYDSVGDDRLAIRHQFTSMRSESLFRLAFGFEKVHAFSTNGGVDRADLYDSPGDDRLAANESFASISSRNYYAGATGFDIIHAHATAGGNDYATLFATDTSALWTRSADRLQWSLPSGETRIAQGFETTEAYVSGGKIEVLTQAVRQLFHEQERKAARDLFAMLDDDER